MSVENIKQCMLVIAESTEICQGIKGLEARERKKGIVRKSKNDTLLLGE